MPFRLRKSVKIAPGVRMNVGKRGGSVTVGGRHGRISRSTRGRTTYGMSGPRGSGVGYSKSSKAGCAVLAATLITLGAIALCGLCLDRPCHEEAVPC
jgi:hypothetical protein